LVGKGNLEKKKELFPYLKSIRSKQRRKCMGTGKERVVLVSIKDLGIMEDIINLTENVLIMHSTGKQVSNGSLRKWLEKAWQVLLGYLPRFHNLIRGQIGFEI
jgi:hypothetical protein